MTNEQLEKMKSIKWWHNIEIEPGVFTGGPIKDMKVKASTHMGMPEDLTGKRVLDCGAWNGGYSFIAEQRGASEVLAIDIFQNKDVGSIDGFNFAKEILQSKVEFKDMGVYDVTPESVGMFDVTLFYGVLYHLDDCWKAMKNIASITKEMCVMETALCLDKSLLYHPSPMAEWLYGFNGITRKFDDNGDHYNKWHPNLAFIHKMAKDVGFKRCELFHIHGNKTRATFKLYQE